jgi:hypothetical protein
MNKDEIINGGMYRLHSTPEHALDTWCKHNLLVARVYDDGGIGFKDTYWYSDPSTYTFDDVCDRISFVFDMNHGKDVTKREWQEYDDKDKTWIPIGGISEQWIVDDRAEKSPEMITYALEIEIARLHEDIESMERSLEWKNKTLAEHIINTENTK